MTQHSVVQKYRFSQSPMASPCSPETLIAIRTHRANQKKQKWRWLQLLMPHLFLA